MSKQTDRIERIRRPQKGYDHGRANTHHRATLVGDGISAEVYWGTDAGSSQRYYLLDVGEGGADGNIAITVEVCYGAECDERMAAATPLIESFVFDVDPSTTEG